MAADVTISKRAILDPYGHRDGDLDRIFFESSATQSFETDAARNAFRDRWLGRYLTQYPDWIYVAATLDGSFIGYLLGCLDDPAVMPLFDDIGYFKAFPHLTSAYPAHLHVNLISSARGRGIGAQLVEAFAADAAAAGSAGIHVVTGEGMRNIRFYANVGFEIAGSIPWNGRNLVFLGRKLSA